jgi:hypothetical protein
VARAAGEHHLLGVAVDAPPALAGGDDRRELAGVLPAAVLQGAVGLRLEQVGSRRHQVVVRERLGVGEPEAQRDGFGRGDGSPGAVGVLVEGRPHPLGEQVVEPVVAVVVGHPGAPPGRGGLAVMRDPSWPVWVCRRVPAIRAGPAGAGSDRERAEGFRGLSVSGAGSAPRGFEDSVCLGLGARRGFSG